MRKLSFVLGGAFCIVLGFGIARTWPAQEQVSVESTVQKPTASASIAPDAAADDSAVAQVIEMQPYIVNLADTGESHYLRLTVSVGLGGEEKPSQLLMTRIRNAMLAVLMSKTSAEVLSADGKAKLRKDLLRAARAASTQSTVEAIYITEFIVQL